MRKMREFLSLTIKNIWFGLKTNFLATPFYFCMKLITMMAHTAIPLINLWLWKEVLNGVVNYQTDGNAVMGYLIIYLSLQLLTYILVQCDRYVNARYYEEITYYTTKILIDKTSRVDLSFYDSAQMRDKLSHAGQNFRAMTETTWLVFDIVSEMINIVVTLIVVTSYKWWLGLVTLLLLIPSFLYNKNTTEKRLQMEKDQLRDNRKLSYFKEIFFHYDVQFEIKLNHLGTYFMDRYKEIWKKLYRINRKEDIRESIFSALFMIINVASTFLVLTVSMFDVIARRIGIGDLQYNLNMVSRLRSQTEWIMMDINRFLNNNSRLMELQDFMAFRPESEKSGTLLPSRNPKIEFCDVSFRYPNCEEYVLRHCSFTIEPHEKVGLIGLNGAGKSTIIKLLFRFYDPEEGCIKYDGVDLKEYDIYEVRKIFGVLFQDFPTYCLPLREIIALSDFDERFNDEKLQKACDISGASEIIKDWEDGFDSVLGRHYANNGKDLSGGQWQIVCLARAYFKDCDYMILDEPSAALDPFAEDRIFEQLYRLSDGKSSVTISHRLSNTTLADKILVLDGGRILEQGSHAELLKQNGKYAHLFRLQASKYL